MSFRIVQLDGLDWDEYTHYPGRHRAALTDTAGFRHTRANLIRHEAGAIGPRHVERTSPRVLAGLYPYRLRRYVLRRNVVAPTGSRRNAFRSVPVPALDDGPHLGYAIQWFAFAIIAVVGSMFLYRREKREP